MVEIATAKVSAKRQIVIPSSLGMAIDEGDTIVFLKQGNQVIMKKANDMDKQLEKDLEFAARTERAWKDIEAGKGIKRTKEEFLNELKDW